MLLADGHREVVRPGGEDQGIAEAPDEDGDVGRREEMKMRAILELGFLLAGMCFMGWSLLTPLQIPGEVDKSGALCALGAGCWLGAYHFKRKA